MSWRSLPSRDCLLWVVRVGFAMSVACPVRRPCRTWRIAALTPTGSGRSSTSGARGPTSRLSAIARTQSASVPTSTRPATRSSGSSTRSSNVGGLQTDMISSQRTILPSSSGLRFVFGYAFMSPRPSSLLLDKMPNSLLFLCSSRQNKNTQHIDMVYMLQNS